jgi:hypothetical protein
MSYSKIENDSIQTEKQWKEFENEILNKWDYVNPTELKNININFFREKIGIEKSNSIFRIFQKNKSLLSILASKQIFPLIKYLNKCNLNKNKQQNSITNQYIPVTKLKYKYSSYTALEASIYSYLDNIDKIKDDKKDNYKTAFEKTVINLILCEKDSSPPAVNLSASSSNASSSSASLSATNSVNEPKYQRLLNGSNLSLIVQSDKYQFERFKSKNTTPFHIILVYAANTDKNYSPFKNILKVICDNLNLLTIDINEVDDWGFSGFYILTWYLIKDINKKINFGNNDNNKFIGKFIELGGNPFINNFIQNFQKKINKNSYNSIIEKYPKNVYEILKPNYPILITKINESSKIFAMQNKKSNAQETVDEIALQLNLDHNKTEQFKNQAEQILELNEKFELQESKLNDIITNLHISIDGKKELENKISELQIQQDEFQKKK